MGTGFENTKGGNKMKCIRCGNEIYKSMTTEAVELDGGVLVIRNIPCYKCETCDEIHFTGDVIKQLEKIINFAKQHIQEVSIVNYMTAA